MYIEQNNMSTAERVNDEKTAALKGLLGIKTDDSAKDSKTGKPSASSSKKKTKNKAKKPKHSETEAQTKLSEKKSPKNKGKSKSDAKNKASEHFAWSAFQASPDPSSLPIPAFTSPSSSTKEVIPTDSLDTDKLAVLLSNVRTSDQDSSEQVTPANAPRAEDLEAEFLAKAEQAKADTEKDQRNANEDEVPDEVATAVDPPESGSEPAVEQEVIPEVTQKPTSSSGINLAEIASSPPGKTEASPSVSTTAANPALPPPPPGPAAAAPPPPQQQYRTPPPHYVHPHYQQQQPHLHHQHYPSPPGYMTIQVRVPPQLMPGRRMVVPSPAGYPVQVVVPQDIPPGMVIPVHVPAPMPMPHHHPHQYPQQHPYGYHLQQPPPHRATMPPHFQGR